jgi:hypothetical protein
MSILSRDQLIARLVARHPLRVLGDAGLDDERVPVAFFAEFRTKGLIEELSPGEWLLSAKGTRRLKPR